MTIAAILMGALVGAMILVEATKRSRAVYGALKLAASGVFVATAVLEVPEVQGAPLARQVFLSALVLSFLGDALLVPKGKRTLFIAGLSVFLFAHVLFVPAFALRGLDPVVVVIAMAALIGPVVLALRWLRPHVKPTLWPAVVAYCVVISVMLSTACGAVAFGQRSAAGVAPVLALGALAFWFSDLFVARERFVRPGLANRIFGLPLYFFGQLGLIAGFT